MALGHRVEKQDVWMWAKALAGVGFVTWLIGLFWHGYMGYPSTMGMMMGFGYAPSGWGASVAFFTLPLFVLGGAFYGWLFATIWNWIAEKKV